MKERSWPSGRPSRPHDHILYEMVHCMTTVSTRAQEGVVARVSSASPRELCNQYKDICDMQLASMAAPASTKTPCSGPASPASQVLRDGADIPAPEYFAPHLLPGHDLTQSNIVRWHPFQAVAVHNRNSFSCRCAEGWRMLDLAPPQSSVLLHHAVLALQSTVFPCGCCHAG